jgi:enoyl-CoA hydratase
MVVRIEKDGPVWTVIHDRPEARNAMDPESADALTEAFLQFDADDNASVAVFYGGVRRHGKLDRGRHEELDPL